uniref:Uncharacterized protein n=1 Tax=uncultured bacterium Lac36W TaxID=1403001 RepID=A0A059Q9K5_9BACT|nr:hypothetical protein [uncultured bacterium Lac36W]
MIASHVPADGGPATRMPATQDRSIPWFALALLALGCAGFAAAWTAVAMLTGAQCAWMAPLSALDAAWLLRLGGAKPGAARMGLGIAATVVTIVLANWSIVAANLAGMMGLDFLGSALRLGPSLAWTLSGLANGAAELAWMAAALVLAAIASR